jgi:protein SCO1
MNTEVELRPRSLVVIALNALALGVLAGLLVFPAARQRLFEPADRPSHAGAALIGGPFRLISQTGAPVSDTAFRGRPMLVAFGFIGEADLTPATLQVLSAVLERLGPKADRLAVLFITLDPDRDTPPRLKQYMANYHPRLIGLTGRPVDIAAVAKAYRLPFERIVDPASPSQTTIAFEPLIYLMNRQGEYVTHLSHGLTVDAVIQALEQVL